MKGKRHLDWRAFILHPSTFLLAFGGEYADIFHGELQGEAPASFEQALA
jgi:hypothetical protein